MSVKSVEKLQEEIEDYRLEWKGYFCSADVQEKIGSDLNDRDANENVSDTAVKMLSAKGENYLDYVRDKIELSWLFADDISEVPSYIEHAWFVHFPINFRTSRKIARAARIMNASRVESLVYPFAPLEDGAKKNFFDCLCGFGRSVGVLAVGEELYKGAVSGDPRAVKMYLEMMREIGGLSGSGEGEGDGGIRLELNMVSVGSSQDSSLVECAENNALPSYTVDYVETDYE